MGGVDEGRYWASRLNSAGHLNHHFFCFTVSLRRVGSDCQWFVLQFFVPICFSDIFAWQFLFLFSIPCDSGSIVFMRVLIAYSPLCHVVLLISVLIPRIRHKMHTWSAKIYRQILRFHSSLKKTLIHKKFTKMLLCFRRQHQFFLLLLRSVFAFAQSCLSS